MYFLLFVQNATRNPRFCRLSSINSYTVPIYFSSEEVGVGVAGYWMGIRGNMILRWGRLSLSELWVILKVSASCQYAFLDSLE